MKVYFVSDNIILIFSQSNVNITIDTQIHPVISLLISNQTKSINSCNGKTIKRI